MYTKVLVEGTENLIERRQHLKVLHKDAALPLDAHDLGPLDKPVQVLLGWKGTTALPIPNCFSLFSKSRSVTFSSTSQTQPNQCQIKPWHLTCLKEERRYVMGRSTYCFLLGRHRRLATSLRGLQICGSRS